MRTLGFFHPHGMALAVLVAKAFDLATEDLDEAGGRAQCVDLGIVAEVGVAHPGFAFGEQHITFFPEFGKRRHREFFQAVFLAAVFVEFFNPLHFVHATGVFLLAVKAAAQALEDLEIRARVEQRVDQLVHRQHTAVAVRAVGVDVVALKVGAGGQHDVGKAAGGGPVVVDGHHGFQLAVSQLHAVALRLAVPLVAAAEDRHLVRGELDLGAIEVDLLAGLQQRVNDAGNRHGRAVALVIGVVVLGFAARVEVERESAWHGCPRRRHTDRTVVVRVADAATRQTDLAQHGGQHGTHPVRLFAMLLALNGPAEDQLGAALGHQPRQLANTLGRHTTDGRCPFRRFLNLVFGLALQVGQETIEAQGVGLEEILVVEVFLDQHMGDGQHHGHVGHRVDVLVGAAQVVLRLALDRIQANDLDFLGRDLFLELFKVGVRFVGLGVPADLQVLDRVIGPEDDGLAFLEDQLPRSALRVDLGRAQHIRQDGLAGTGGIVAHRAHAATMHADGADHVVATAVHLPHRAPAHAGGVQGPGAVVFLHALKLFVEQVQRLVPADAHKTVVTALRGVAVVAFFVPVQPHHGVTDARRAVDQAGDALDHLGRVFVVFERAHFHHPVVDHLGADGAKVRAGDLPARKIGTGSTGRTGAACGGACFCSGRICGACGQQGGGHQRGAGEGRQSF